MNMEINSYFILTLLIITINNVEMASEKPNDNTTHNCPFTRIIEDIFKIRNHTTNLKTEPAKLFLDVIDNIDNKNTTVIQDEIISSIIESIKRIKENVSKEDMKLHEALILKPDMKVEKQTNVEINMKAATETKSELEENRDVTKANIKSNETKVFINKNITGTNYVEILTIEPNNTSPNKSNILDVLKHIMPILNSTINKELHSITIVESNENKNHSFTETRNTSTVVVKYCDKHNTSVKVDDLKMINNDDYLENGDYDGLGAPDNMTYDGKRGGDILEAAEYGIQKMNELYTVLEPKLYSMGYSLDHKEPAHYVAAFNAPSEDLARFSRYGYASIQAASKLKELIGISDGLESRTEREKFPSASALRQSPLLEQCPLRGPPKCPPASKRYRTHDGTCNNLNRPRWGSTMTPVQRFQPPLYSDGIQAPRRSIFGSFLPSAREVSALVHEDQNLENPGITHLLMQWGQFIDHDIVSSSQSRGFNGSVPRCCKDGGRDFIPPEFLHPECLPIAVPLNDPFYGPRGVRCLDFIRSSPAPQEDCRIGWREQINQVSAYIDGSPLYASSARQSDKLRLFRNGMLQYGRVQQRRPLLPADHKDELCRGGAVSTDCFKSGDGRVNEHPGLVAAHIIWLRQHNRMATELSHLNPHWSDEKIYQETRKIVGAMIQHITYNEFLPIVLGSEVMRLFELEPQRKGYYRGYSPKTNPSPASSFGAAAFRFGHSLVQPSMVRFDHFHRPIPNNVSLHDELTNPSNIWSMGAVDRLLLGMVNQPIQKRDEFITEELTNHLFQTPHFDFGMDLAAINIQRGRDHGVPAYTSWREPCGLSAIQQFDDLLRVMPARVVRKLKALYRHVDDVDLFTGGISERPVVGGLVGPTFSCIIAQQFSNLRKGDRFWYENGGLDSSFTPAQLQQIRRISLAQVLCHTLDSIDSVQPFVFLSSTNPDNERVSCFNSVFNNFELAPWSEIKTNTETKKSDDDNIMPKRQKPTTERPTTTTKKQVNLNQKKTNTSMNMTKLQKLSHQLNISDLIETTTDDLTIKIDDKLDFKNKTRRYADEDVKTRRNPTQGHDYDDVQSVQSVVINNMPYKRPPSRPYISVTENIDKYTYLINYVPRPTQSWRQTTKRNYDRDVVKVTYQTYDDTYRRPNRPYYNRDEFKNDFESRHSSDITDDVQSSARSNEDSVETKLVTDRPNLDKVTDKILSKDDKINLNSDKVDDATEQYKLLTFGYVGTYKSGGTDRNIRKETENSGMISKDLTHKESKKAPTPTEANIHDKNKDKISTFFHYDTSTKPYSAQRPTKRQDATTKPTATKYYYIDNVLKQYPEGVKPVPVKNKSNVNKDKTEAEKVDIEERSVAHKMPALEDKTERPKVKVKGSGSAKTPSVSFQIIPSENSPSQWAVYEEREDLLDSLLYKMPAIKTDPMALREIPRPITFARKPARPPRQ